MKRNDVESISTNVVNIGTILYWILSAVTAIVLGLQPQPVVLPGYFEIGPVYKLIFYTSLILGYIQLLRKYWENQKRRGNDVEGKFGSYLFGSVIKLKRPIILIGFITIFGIIGIFLFTELPFLAVIIPLVGGSALLTYFLDGNGWPHLIREYDDDYRKRWLKRVRNKLYENGFANTLDFWDLPSSTADEIEWAINLYFHLYEFEQDLIFREKYYEEDGSGLNVCVIRFKHVPSQLPEVLK